MLLMWWWFFVCLHFCSVGLTEISHRTGLFIEKGFFLKNVLKDLSAVGS